MSQSHLVLDFPIEAPANAKALAEELPALDARSREGAGRPRDRAFLPFHARGRSRSFSSSRTSTARATQHIERLVESAGPVFDAIFEHVDDPPATPVAE